MSTFNATVERPFWRSQFVNPVDGNQPKPAPQFQLAGQQVTRPT
jgi:hypothetical protein